MSNSNSDFASLGLSPAMLAALEEKGFTSPSPIQKAVIPVLLKADHDVIGQAHTGTGKTAAFAIPLIERLDPEQFHTQALILAPTRELALQICKEFQSLQGEKRFNIVPIYGGSSYTEQFRALKQGAHIVVGTPGRVLDHIDKNTLKLNTLSYLVLDEADEMLNMGFVEDVEAVLANAPDERTILMFSATMPKRLMDIASRYMRNHELISVKHEALTTTLTEQLFYEIKESDKFEALCRIIAATPSFYGIVFCRTKADVDNVAAQLNARSIATEALHGDVQQNQREKILRKFKAGNIRVLVATDVAARGIDVQELSHVINFSLPTDPETYVHRIGRTGRAGREGTAISIITPSEFRKISFIQKITKSEIKRGKLPTADSLVNAKIALIEHDLAEILREGPMTEYGDMAARLLMHAKPSDLIAALLEYGFGEELLAESYPEVHEFDGAAARKDKGKGGGYKGDRNGGGKDKSRYRDRESRDREGAASKGDRYKEKSKGEYRKDRSEKSDRPEKSDRTERGDRPRADRDERPRGDKPRSERPERSGTDRSDKKSEKYKSSHSGKRYGDEKMSYGEKSSYGDKPPRREKSFGEKSGGEKSYSERKTYGDKPAGGGKVEIKYKTASDKPKPKKDRKY